MTHQKELLVMNDTINYAQWIINSDTDWFSSNVVWGLSTTSLVKNDNIHSISIENFTVHAQSIKNAIIHQVLNIYQIFQWVTGIKPLRKGARRFKNKYVPLYNDIWQ